MEEERVNRKRELVLLALSLFCIPIAIVDKQDMFFEFFDTHWLFIWGTYSGRYGQFFPIPYSNTPAYEFADLISWLLAFLWIGVTIVTYYILQRRSDNTFVRDIGFLATLLIGQVLAPLALFALAVQEGTSFYITWILPFPGPSLIAMILRVYYRIKAKE